MRATLAALLGALLAAHAASAERLDWEVEERAEPAPAVRAARNVRDGVLGLGDAFFDANTALFGAFALAASQVCMAASDGIGLVDDNPLSEHVTKGILSKNLAKVAWLWHQAGAESLLGSHGLEKERWIAGQVAELNPLLSGEDVAELEGPLPLDPLAFVGEATLHTETYRPHAPVVALGAALLADGALRPAASLLRIAQLERPADALDARATDTFRRALGFGW
jgi:hypothetical protein